MALTHSLQSQINAIAKQYGIPPALFTGLIRQESGFDNSSHSGAGAIGYTQLMPGTARGLGVNPYDPKQNLIGGAKYLAAQLKAFNGDTRKALAAYNAGPGAVRKYGGIPPYAETQNYVTQVLKYAQMYGAGGVPTAGGDTAARIDTAAPQVAIPDFEQARSPLSASLAPRKGLGVLGTSVRSPNLQIKPLNISVAPPQSLATDLSAGGGGGAAQFGGTGYPLGKHGKIIGTPHSGTHTLGNWQSDNAIDISVPVGTPVYATTDGVIGSRIGSLGKGGRFAGLRLTLEGGGNAYYYAHLSKLRVKAGQRVKRGQLLGYSGSANGVAHLHFGMEHGNPVQAYG